MLPKSISMKRLFIALLGGILPVLIAIPFTLLYFNKDQKAIALEAQPLPLNVRWMGPLVHGDPFSDQKVVIERNIQIGLRDNGVVVWRMR